MIDPLFGYTLLNESGRLKATDVATHFTILLEALEEICPKGRELSIVRTKLEEASFYAKKSLVHFEGNRA
jgi:hypothetical protein